MSSSPLIPDNTVNGAADKREFFDENSNIIHCNLSINSTTIYTYDNSRILHKVNLNYPEIITQNLGDINETQEDGMDHLNLAQSLVVDGNSPVELKLYYKKNLMENNDLVTIVILCSRKMLSSFVHNLLEILSFEYITQYYNQNKKYEFKLKMKDLIQVEESKLVTVYQSYGSVDNELSEMRNIMNENIDKILKRGDNLDTLLNKTSNLNTTSKSFKKNSTAIKRKFMWANVKFWVIVSLVVISVVYILLGLECGLPVYTKCLHPSKPPQPTPTL